jgi:hypothetical protein
MAGGFGCDPMVAGQMSRELAGIRTSIESLGDTFTGYRGASGSERVEGALDDFFAKSSDSRTAMSGLLERASGLLQALAEGTAAVDQALDGSLAAPAAATGDRPGSTLTSGLRP